MKKFALLIFAAFVLTCCTQRLPPTPVEISRECRMTVAEIPTSIETSEKRSCPSGMIEITGDYCITLTHRCLAGRTQDWKPVRCPNGCPTPHFCDTFVEGSAVCATKSIRGSDGRMKNVSNVVLKHFCIDDYEYPNRIGETPTVMVTWYRAKELCEAAGKRLCGDDEWTLACEGPERRPYPYGWTRDNTACNIDHDQRARGPNWGALGARAPEAIRNAEVARLDQRVPIGASPRCISPYGVHDMAGNVDEWTTNVTRAAITRNKSFFKGGHWLRGARNRCRPITDGHTPDFSGYAEGFRCCADPK